MTSAASESPCRIQAQKLARHCSPLLTSSIYSRFGFDEDAAAIAKLPKLAAVDG